MTEEKRKQLDGIVQQMIANKESDDNVQFVVDDFKKKYSRTTEQPKTKGVIDTLIDNPITRGVQKIFPGKKVGEAIGTLGGLGITAIKEKIGVIPKGTTEAFDISAPSPLQVGADIASGALNVAGFKGAGTAGTFGQRILKMAGIGAGLSGAEAIKEKGGVKEVSKKAIFGGMVGAAIPVAGAGLRIIGRQIEQLPARFVNSALSRNKAQVLQDISKDKIDDFAQYVLKSKPIGTANKLVNESINNVDDLSNKINTALSSATRQTGSKITIGRNNLLDTIAKLPEAEGALLKRNDIKGIIEKLAPQTKKLLQKESLTIVESNQLRQLVDKTLGDRAFLGSQLSSDKIILKTFANTLREQVKSKAPEGTRALFSELSNEIRFRDGLLNKIAQRAGNQVLSFGDFIGGGLGGIFGGGIPGAVAGVASRRAIESVPFKLGAAKLISASTKLEPIINQLAPAQQTAILDFFAEIFSQDNPKKDQVE